MERREVNAKATGEFLAALRKSKGYTQVEVAELLGVTNKTVSKWERGDGLPEISMLPVLAEVYEITADELLAGKRLEKETVEKKELGRQWRYCYEQAEYRLTNLCLIAAAVFLGGFFLVKVLKKYLFGSELSIAAAFTAGLWFWLLGTVLWVIGFRSFIQRIGAIPQEEDKKKLYSDCLERGIKKSSVTAGISGGLIFLSLKAAFLEKLPAAVIVGLLTGIFLQLFLMKRYKIQLKKQLGIVMGILLAGILVSGGFRGFTNAVINKGVAQTLPELEFASLVNHYFQVYNAFKNARNMEGIWPEQEKGDEIVHPEYFDEEIKYHERYADYVGIIRFDYENHTVYRKYSGEALEAEKKTQTNGEFIILLLTCLAVGGYSFLVRRQS